MLRLKRPFEIWSMLADIFAVIAGSLKPGRMAFINSTFSVTDAIAAAVVQHSSTGAVAPLMSLRFSSASK